MTSALGSKCMNVVAPIGSKRTAVGMRYTSRLVRTLRICPGPPGMGRPQTYPELPPCRIEFVLRKHIYAQTGAAKVGAFQFLGARCDRMVSTVMERIQALDAASLSRIRSIIMARRS